MSRLMVWIAPIAGEVELFLDPVQPRQRTFRLAAPLQRESAPCVLALPCGRIPAQPCLLGLLLVAARHGRPIGRRGPHAPALATQLPDGEAGIIENNEM
jgi:hypothetical protein